MQQHDVTFWGFFFHHETGITVFLCWIGSNIVSSLPSPMSETSFYRFIFNLAHGLAGSIGRISPIFRIPGANGTGADTPPATPPAPSLPPPALGS